MVDQENKHSACSDFVLAGSPPGQEGSLGSWAPCIRMNGTVMPHLFKLAFVLLALLNASAAPQVRAPVLVELFTSEG